MKTKVRDLAKKMLKRSEIKKNKFLFDKKQVMFLSSLIKKYHFKHILLFCPLKGESNISPLLFALKKTKSKIFIPRVRGEEMDIVSFRFPLQKKKFQILESSSTHCYPQKLDLAIVPALAFDRLGGRIGFGKGYYDRFFKKLGNKPYIIFISHFLLFYTEEVTQDFDIRADLILASNFIFKRGRYGIFATKPYCGCHHRRSRLIFGF